MRRRTGSVISLLLLFFPCWISSLSFAETVAVDQSDSCNCSGWLLQEIPVGVPVMEGESEDFARYLEHLWYLKHLRAEMLESKDNETLKSEFYCCLNRILRMCAASERVALDFRRRRGQSSSSDLGWISALAFLDEITLSYERDSAWECVTEGVAFIPKRMWLEAVGLHGYLDFAYRFAMMDQSAGGYFTSRAEQLATAGRVMETLQQDKNWKEAAREVSATDSADPSEQVQVLLLRFMTTPLGRRPDPSIAGQIIELAERELSAGNREPILAVWIMAVTPFRSPFTSDQRDHISRLHRQALAMTPTPAPPPSGS